MWNFPKHSLRDLSWKSLTESCDVITSTVFQIQNFEKNWQEIIHVGMEYDWSGSFVLLYVWNTHEDVRWYFSIYIHWEVMSNLSVFRLVAKLKIVPNFPTDLNRKNPTIHLHYFIHRSSKKKTARPIIFDSYVNILACQFFQIFEFENHWCDDVTWLLSMIFMKDHGGERSGKISHPYRVWKVYKQRCLENT